MLQIIGFLGCLYLFVKGLDMISRVLEQRALNAPNEAPATGPLTVGAWLCFLGSVFFLLWLLAQGGAFESSTSSYGDYGLDMDAIETEAAMEADALEVEAERIMDCIDAAETNEQIEAC